MNYLCLVTKPTVRAGVGVPFDTRSARIGLNPKAKLVKNMTAVAITDDNIS
jgi:hypothetical protein